jgi:hypothetical protein
MQSYSHFRHVYAKTSNRIRGNYYRNMPLIGVVTRPADSF